MSTPLRATYLRTLLLKDELTSTRQVFESAKYGIDWLKAVKQLFTPIHTVMESLGEFGEIMRTYQFETPLTKVLQQQKRFVQHVRNKVCGHLDSKVLLRAAHWTPQIFSDSMKKEKREQLYFIYKSLIESAVNSYVARFPVDHKGKQTCHIHQMCSDLRHSLSVW